MADIEDGPAPRAEEPPPPRRLGLSGRLLILTIGFVLLAEILISVPSVANFRRNWLTDRIAAAQIAALVLEAAPDQRVSDELANRLLAGVGAQAIAVKAGGARRLLSANEVPERVARMSDLRRDDWTRLVADAARTLFAPAILPIRVVGQGMGGVDFVELVLDETPLREAMIAYGTRILLVSLLISGITAGLLFLALQWVIVRPVRRIAQNMAAFAGDPEDASRVMAPSRRTDEIGLAETALARMEAALSGEIRQKRRLAELGLAVSKINHELRNLLTTAQLLGDRLEHAVDPTVQRVAPRLLATLGRAVRFCEATLAYGRAAEPAPERRLVPLKPIVAELHDLVGLAPEAGIVLQDGVPDGLHVDADPEQLARALTNLVRNAVQALGLAGPSGGTERRVRIDARRDGATVAITVCDNGPGLPDRARANLFAPFSGSARPGGTGLGLAIAAELVRLNGGTLTLEPGEVGARFLIVIGDREGK